MPGVLAETFDRWLDPENEDISELIPLLRPAPAGASRTAPSAHASAVSATTIRN